MVKVTSGLRRTAPVCACVQWILRRAAYVQLRFLAGNRSVCLAHPAGPRCPRGLGNAAAPPAGCALGHTEGERLDWATQRARLRGPAPPEPTPTRSPALSCVGRGPESKPGDPDPVVPPRSGQLGLSFRGSR